MGEEFAPGFKEIFQCTVRGKDITDGRFNAWTALETAIGDLPMHHWKLAQMEHGISVEEVENNGETELISFVVTQAAWIFDPESDGGTTAELFGPEPIDPDGIENEMPELHLVDNKA